MSCAGPFSTDWHGTLDKAVYRSDAREPLRAAYTLRLMCTKLPWPPDAKILRVHGAELGSPHACATVLIIRNDILRRVRPSIAHQVAYPELDDAAPFYLLP